MKKKNRVFIFILLFFMVTILRALDFYDATQVNTIQLFFPQSNWDQLLDNLFAAGNEDRLLGTAIINGVTYDSVGVRYKGNSSYSATRVKNPFNIKLDYIIDDQLIDDKYGTIKLANGFSDPSFVRETLSYEIARKYMPASKANYAKVYVNNVLIGAYTSVQDVDSYFMEDQLHCTDKFRFKCDTNTMGSLSVWGYLGADSTSYAQYYGIESDYGWANLINFTNTLANNQTNIANVMNVDQHLWMCAFDNLLVNLDSPINIFHNFYLFGDADNRFNPLLWDLNMSFGGFAQGMTTTTMQNMDPLRNSTSSTFILLSHVLSNARYKKMYIAHMRTMLAENFTNQWYSTRAAELQTICSSLVQTDPNFFYTYANFQSNLNNSVSGGSGGPGGGTICGITQLMSTRANYLLNSTAFQGTVPIITAINHSPQVIVQNSMVNFTMSATNAIYAQIGIRNDISDKFAYYQMYDDGTHNDGAAGDGVFGISVNSGFGILQYYGYAENAAQGVFLPARAEHEFFELNVEVEPGEILINEIMAKNASFPDADGDMDDWVELYNTSDTPTDIGGMYMTDSHFSNGISAWTQIPVNDPTTTTIPAHGFLRVWFDEETDQGPLHINDKLGGSADAVYLIDSDGLTVVDSYTWVDATGLNVDDISIGRIPDGGATWMLFGAGQAQPCTPGATNQGNIINVPPTITNVQYSPHDTDANSIITISALIQDADNNLSEIMLLWGLDNYNQNTLSMTLQGNSYSGIIGPFPIDSNIQYRIKAVDTQNEVTLSPVYNIIIGYQTPTLYINEIMASNTISITDDYGEYEDWVELYNPTDNAVNLAGCFMLDSHYYDNTFIPLPISSEYPDSTTIPAHGFKVYWFDEDTEQGVLHIDSKLGISGDGVYLLAPDMITVIDSISWTTETNLGSDQSYGRYPDGSTNWMLFGLNPDSPTTPGASNLPTHVNDHTASVSPILSVYPNPCNDRLNIVLKNSNTQYKAQIYNIKGQLVREINCEPNSKINWNLTDISGNQIPTGLYLMKVISGKYKCSKKICIMH